MAHERGDDWGARERSGVVNQADQPHQEARQQTPRNVMAEAQQQSLFFCVVSCHSVAKMTGLPGSRHRLSPHTLKRPKLEASLQDAKFLASSWPMLCRCVRLAGAVLACQ